MKPRAIVVDIDGTLAIRGHRSPYDWRSVEQDTPNVPIVKLVQHLASACTVVFVSGRDERGREDTCRWISKNVGVQGELFMRPQNDQRPDSELKRTIYNENIQPHFDVWLVVDDRNKTVDMWRKIGLTCLQVADGDF